MNSRIPPVGAHHLVGSDADSERAAAAAIAADAVRDGWDVLIGEPDGAQWTAAEIGDIVSASMLKAEVGNLIVVHRADQLGANETTLLKPLEENRQTVWVLVGAASFSPALAGRIDSVLEIEPETADRDALDGWPPDQLEIVVAALGGNSRLAALVRPASDLVAIVAGRPACVTEAVAWADQLEQACVHSSGVKEIARVKLARWLTDASLAGDHTAAAAIKRAQDLHRMHTPLVSVAVATVVAPDRTAS